MATKKSNDLQPEAVSEYLVFHQANSTVYTDDFAIDKGVAAIQGNILQNANRLFKGWFVNSLSAKGFLARQSNKSYRDFVVRIEFSVEFTPFTHPAINRAETLYFDLLSKLPKNPVESPRVDVLDD